MLAALLLVSVIPVQYDLTLAPHHGWFSGSETIDIEIGATTRSVRLDAVGLAVTHAVASVGGRPLAISFRQESNALVLVGAFPAGRVTLEIAWQGKMSPDRFGMYESGGGFFTQLEPNNARRVFPCVDRPGLRARFRVHAWVAADQKALSNGAVASELVEGASRKIDFAETPPLPTYLVALAVGRFDVAEGHSADRPVRIFVAPGRRADAEKTLQVAIDVLERLEDYLGVPFPFSKLDIVAAPDLPVLAMENAGAIFVRAEDVLRSDRAQVHRLAHEIAHQWFGDLVTMASWRDLWLSEALARWAEFETVDALHPDWHIWIDFQRLRQHALSIDSRHPIRAGRPIFDEITYDKGAAVLRMLQSWMGPDSFRAALHEYLVTHSLGIASAEDFWSVMASHSTTDVFALGRSWLDRPGHPTLEVKSLCRNGALEIQLDQDTHPLWPLPVHLEAGATTLNVLLRHQHESLLLRDPEGCPAKVTADGDEPYLVRYTDRHRSHD